MPDALAATVRTWDELDQLEKDHDLSFLREPDLGFAWAAYRWARGARLESVLAETPDLTPGDFVRSVKQLIDLLDQIAAATPPPPADGTSRPADTSRPDGPPRPGDTSRPDGRPRPDDPSRPDGPSRPRDLAATARAAIDAMRRGVVAYSAVTD